MGVTLSGREICPFLMHPSTFLILNKNENTSSGKELTLIKQRYCRVSSGDRGGFSVNQSNP